MLSDNNIRAVTRLIDHIDQATSGLPRSARNVDALVDALRESTAAAQRVIDDLHGTTQTASIDLLAAVQQLRATSDNLASASGTLNAVANENRDQLRNFVSEGLPQFEALLRDSRTAAQQLGELSRTLTENPSQLIYQPAGAGVSIPP